MRVGDFLDAMGGYNDAEIEKVKSLAELLRTQTWLLWNIQVPRDEKLDADKLWPLPWDKENIKQVPQREEQNNDESVHNDILEKM
jgi:hypothetical protein